MKQRNIVLTLIIFSLLSGLITGNKLLFTLTYLLGLLLILSFFWAWANLNWLHLSRVTRTRRTQVGKPLEERFSLRNTSRLPKLWVEMRDFSQLPSHHASRVLTVKGHGFFSWRVQTICPIRGRYQLGPIKLRTSDPFGLFSMERDLLATSQLVVLPLTFPIKNFALPIGILPGGDALRRRTHYVTTNASGVRDYAPGDSFSRIHWKSSARRNRLIAKEFELDPLADIWIVPDLSIYGHIAPQEAPNFKPNKPLWMQVDEYQLPASTEEYTVAVAASLAEFFIRRDRNVGLLAFGQTHEILQPDRGERQLNRILEILAVLRTRGEIPIEDIMQSEMKIFPRGTTVIVITPTTNEKWSIISQQLTRRGLRMVTVLIDGKSFGGHLTTNKLEKFLEATGQTVYTIKNGDNIGVALSQKPSGASTFLT